MSKGCWIDKTNRQGSRQGASACFLLVNQSFRTMVCVLSYYLTRYPLFISLQDSCREAKAERGKVAKRDCTDRTNRLNNDFYMCSAWLW